MDNDRLINLLPDEYLPEPEFKAFPIFAAALIILTILFVYTSYQRDRLMIQEVTTEYNAIEQRITGKAGQAMPFVDIQANARFISSYFGIIPSMVLRSPDYWEIYSEVERLLPESTWVQSLQFRGGAGGWPSLQINFLSKGYSFEGPLATYDAFLGKPGEPPTRFRALQMAGYQRARVAGGAGASFTIRMQTNMPTSMRIEDKGIQEEEDEPQGDER